MLSLHVMYGCICDYCRYVDPLLAARHILHGPAVGPQGFMQGREYDLCRNAVSPHGGYYVH
jgi:hypothetical protein